MQITWRIVNLEWIEQVGENTNVVKNVHWWVQAVDGDSMGYTWGNTQLNIDNIESFSSLDELNEDIVIGWVKNEINNTYTKDGVDGVDIIEGEAKTMCAESDPLRKRQVGLPWQ